MRRRLRKTQQLRNSAPHASTKWCIWKTAANPHSITSWWVDAAAADPHSEHRDGLMLEVQKQCDGLSTKNEDIENLVGRQEWLMSYGTCQLPPLVRVFVLASLARPSPPGLPDFSVVLLWIRGFQRLEFVNLFQQQLVFCYLFLHVSLRCTAQCPWQCVSAHLANRASRERKEVGGYSCQFFVWRSLFDSCIQNGYKDGTSLRSRRTRTWWILSLEHRNACIAEGVWKTWSTIQSIQEGSSKKIVEYCVDHKNSWVTFEQFKDTLVVFR